MNRNPIPVREDGRGLPHLGRDEDPGSLELLSANDEDDAREGCLLPAELDFPFNVRAQVGVIDNDDIDE